MKFEGNVIRNGAKVSLGEVSNSRQSFGEVFIGDGKLRGFNLPRLMFLVSFASVFVVWYNGSLHCEKSSTLEKNVFLNKNTFVLISWVFLSTKGIGIKPIPFTSIPGLVILDVGFMKNRKNIIEFFT